MIALVIIVGIIIAIAYLHNLRKKCPYCKSDNVTEKFLDTSTHSYCRKCNVCGRKFMA